MLDASSHKENMFKGTITATDIIYVPLKKIIIGEICLCKSIVAWKEAQIPGNIWQGWTEGLRREQVDSW